VKRLAELAEFLLLMMDAAVCFAIVVALTYGLR
jgi:hypothetical protein